MATTPARGGAMPSFSGSQLHDGRAQINVIAGGLQSRLAA
jgi:hypothetical protein